jgi:F-type H+-transporting ATPase subunit epsilon
VAGGLTLRVITPDAIVFDEEVESVRVPGLDGSIGILPRHAHTVAALDIGLLRYRRQGKEQRLFVAGGFAEVRANTVRVVCEAGEKPEEIDEERARAAEARAKQRLDEGGFTAAQIDILRAELALRRAQGRLRARAGLDRLPT